MYTGERQAAKMRLAYLRSMLDQDISVFDTEASTGEVINAITSDIIIVQDAISEKVCIYTYMFCLILKFCFVLMKLLLLFFLLFGCMFYQFGTIYYHYFSVGTN